MTAVQGTVRSPKPQLNLTWPAGLQLDVLARDEGGGFVVVSTRSVDLALRDRVVIGRQQPTGAAPSCDIGLDDESVSRRHCELTFETGQLRLRDLASTNGVWFPHARLEGSALLSNGAVFYVGNCPLRARLDTETVKVPNTDRLGRMRGASDPTRALFSKLQRVAPTPLSVLILGETGTGKGEAALAIHELSGRAGPFVKLDCARLPPSLAESEIFGHVQGAYTGATRDKPSPFEQAAGGTLFLDEVGELRPELQQKLLGVLEDRVVTRVGGERPIPIDTRVVAATNLDVDTAMEDGGFRTDLYYRLSGVVLVVAPLRDRGADVRVLARHFLKLAGEELGRPLEITQEALAVLESRRWPGNIRELRNVVQRAAYLSEPGKPVSSEDFHLDLRREPILDRRPADAPVEEALAAVVEGCIDDGRHLKDIVSLFEQRYCRRVLEKEGGNVTRAAALSGYTRTGFANLLKRLELGG